MEEEMRELHVEGLATHGGPESCVDDPRGRGEALTGARAGRAIEPRNAQIGVPTLSERWKATSWAALPRGAGGPGAVREPGHVRIVQRSVVEVLNAVYETDFRGFSYGFRPGRNPHDALDALAAGLEKRKVNWG